MKKINKKIAFWNAASEVIFEMPIAIGILLVILVIVAAIIGVDNEGFRMLLCGVIIDMMVTIPMVVVGQLLIDKRMRTLEEKLKKGL